MEKFQSLQQEVLQFVEENDVKFIRLVFCDLDGLQKNISIMPEQLETAFIDGIPFDASYIWGMADVSQCDLFLRPDPATISLLPWRPQQGRVARFYCTIEKPNGEVFEADTREILKKAVEDCRKMQLECTVGSECEFYLFKTDEDGNPTKEPLDQGSYFDMAPVDKGENVRRDICLALEGMGLHPEVSHHEQGPGQNEIDFRFSDLLSAADDFMSFKTTVKAVSAQNGLYASFLPKPIKNASGSGMHINLSLYKEGKNIFDPSNPYKEISENFIAGVLDKIKEISLFLNPIANSYERFGEFEAPKYISLSSHDRSQLIRIPAASKGRCRMELRSPDPALNPYLAYALIVQAGLKGIEQGLTIHTPIDPNTDSDNTIALKELPHNINEAIKEAKNSSFVAEVIGKELLEKYISLKENSVVSTDTYFRYI